MENSHRTVAYFQWQRGKNCSFLRAYGKNEADKKGKKLQRWNSQMNLFPIYRGIVYFFLKRTWCEKCYHCWTMGKEIFCLLILAWFQETELKLPCAFHRNEFIFEIFSCSPTPHHMKAPVYPGSRAPTELGYWLYCWSQLNIGFLNFRKSCRYCISSVYNKKGSNLLRTFKLEFQVKGWLFERHNKGVKFRQFVDGIKFVLPGYGHSLLGWRSTRLELGVGLSQALLSSRKRSHMQTLIYKHTATNNAWDHSQEAELACSVVKQFCSNCWTIAKYCQIVSIAPAKEYLPKIFWPRNCSQEAAWDRHTLWWVAEVKHMALVPLVPGSGAGHNKFTCTDVATSCTEKIAAWFECSWSTYLGSSNDFKRSVYQAKTKACNNALDGTHPWRAAAISWGMASHGSSTCSMPRTLDTKVWPCKGEGSAVTPYKHCF